MQEDSTGAKVGFGDVPPRRFPFAGEEPVGRGGRVSQAVYLRIVSRKEGAEPGQRLLLKFSVLPCARDLAAGRGEPSRAGLARTYDHARPTGNRVLRGYI